MRILKSIHLRLILGNCLAFCSLCALASDPEILYLDISVNRNTLPNFTQVKKIDEHFWLLVDDAKQLNLKTEAFHQESGFIELKPGNGLSVDYNTLTQSLRITTDKSWLAGQQKLSNTRPEQLLQEDKLSPSVKGAVVNYELFGSRNENNEAASLYTEFRSLGMSAGTFKSSFNTKYTRTYNDSDNELNRLMTSWQYDNIDKLLRITVGDNYTTTQSWTNSVRFGGLSIAHDYALQPNYNTSAQDVFSDTAVLPSTVDLYVEGVKTSAYSVDSGQFTLNTAPYFSGVGNATVVITDINGQQRLVNLTLYNTSQLLSEGLNTWALNVGWLRKDYNQSSFNYDPKLMTIGNWRYGLNNRVTLEAHSEIGESLQNIGLGNNVLVAPYLGVINLNASGSQYQNSNGNKWGAGWQWNNQRLSVSLQHSRQNTTYKEVSMLINNTLLRKSSSAFVSWSFDNIGIFGAGWVSRQYRTATLQYANLSWTKTFNGRFTISVNATQELDNEKNKILYAMVNIPLSTNNYLSLQTNKENSNISQQLQYSKTLVPDKEGWGWNIAQQTGQGKNSHADVSYRSDINDWQVGYNRYSGENNYFASNSGAFGVLENQVYAMRKLGDSFAIVDTSGVADLPVYFQNIEVGKTDQNGILLLNDLYSYEPQSIKINPLGLASDFRAKNTEQTIIPRNGNGSLVKFVVYRTQALLLSVKHDGGTSLPVAAEVQVYDKDGLPPQTGTDTTIVGYDSKIYFEGILPGSTAVVTWPNGQCQIALPDITLRDATFIEEEAICQ